MLDYQLVNKLKKTDIIDFAIGSTEIYSSLELNNVYFTHSQTLGLDVQEGVVETPSSIVEFMIELAIARYEGNVKTIKWYDPCSGSGKFAVEIIKRVIKTASKPLDENSLPHISFNELSAYGFYISLLNIKSILNANGLSLRKYIEAGRLCAFLGDALEINPESRDMLCDHEICADIVIGNPPYVRATRLNKEYKTKLKRLYPSVYNGSEDLYSYFYANALNAITKNSVVCFISPSSFFKKTTSKQLRGYLSEISSPDCIVDFDENKIFENISLHAVVCCLKKSKEIEYVNYFHAKGEKQIQSLFNKSFQFDKLPSDNFNEEGWQLESHAISGDKTRKLKDFGLKVRSGIRPGIRSAYVYGANELVNLPINLVRTALQAKSIEKWVTNKSSNDLLFMTNETLHLHEHACYLLEPYSAKLKKEMKVKDNSWMLLRPCSYYDEMNGYKIVFPDIASTPRFSLDKTGSCILDGAFFINSSDKCLLGILNSDIAWQYFKSTCSSIGNVANKGRLRLKKSHVENFPLPSNYEDSIELKMKIEKVIDCILLLGEQEDLLVSLNQYVLEMYS